MDLIDLIAHRRADGKCAEAPFCPIIRSFLFLSLFLSRRKIFSSKHPIPPSPGICYHAQTGTLTRPRLTMATVARTASKTTDIQYFA
jgi:hypothetical protein